MNPRAIRGFGAWRRRGGRLSWASWVVSLLGLLILGGAMADSRILITTTIIDDDREIGRPQVLAEIGRPVTIVTEGGSGFEYTFVVKARDDERLDVQVDYSSLASHFGRHFVADPGSPEIVSDGRVELRILIQRLTDGAAGDPDP